MLEVLNPKQCWATQSNAETSCNAKITTKWNIWGQITQENLFLELPRAIAWQLKRNKIVISNLYKVAHWLKWLKENLLALDLANNLLVEKIVSSIQILQFENILDLHVMTKKAAFVHACGFAGTIKMCLKLWTVIWKKLR